MKNLWGEIILLYTKKSNNKMESSSGGIYKISTNVIELRKEIS